MEDKASFLSRWSQRKIEQQHIDNAEEQDSALISDNEPSLPTAEEPDEVILTDADMPDIETLDESSDFSQFFSSGVSEELRDLALQKLFRLPEFNLRDGLNDYDEDFSKMTALTEAVASQLRNWVEEKVEEKQDTVKEQLSESLTTESDKPDSTSTAITSTARNEASLENTTNTFSSQDESEDDLGDADLEG